MYIMLCGYPPFGGKNDKEILTKVQKGQFEFPTQEWGCVSDEAKDLIRKMIKKNYHKRYSAA